MPDYDKMVVISHEEYTDLKGEEDESPSNVSRVGGEVHGSQVNNIEVGAGGTILIQGEEGVKLSKSIRAQEGALGASKSKRTDARSKRSDVGDAGGGGWDADEPVITRRRVGSSGMNTRGEPTTRSTLREQMRDLTKQRLRELQGLSVKGLPTDRKRRHDETEREEVKSKRLARNRKFSESALSTIGKKRKASERVEDMDMSVIPVMPAEDMDVDHSTKSRRKHILTPRGAISEYHKYVAKKRGREDDDDDERNVKPRTRLNQGELTSTRQLVKRKIGEQLERPTSRSRARLSEGVFTPSKYDKRKRQHRDRQRHDFPAKFQRVGILEDDDEEMIDAEDYPPISTRKRRMENPTPEETEIESTIPLKTSRVSFADDEYPIW
jgi:hypothetical protein